VRATQRGAGGGGNPKSVQKLPNQYKKEGRESQVPPESQFAPFLTQRISGWQHQSKSPRIQNRCLLPCRINRWPGGGTEAPLPVNEIAKYSGFGKH
jgi:hypothetical protein